MSNFDALYLRSNVLMTPGRIKWCARAIGGKLTSDERLVIGPFAERAEEAGRHAYWLFVGRERAKPGFYGPLAKDKNTAMDQASSGVASLLDVFARVHAPGTDVGDRARRLTAAFFPLSLKHVTNSAYATELAAVRRIVALGTGELAEDVAVVPGLTALLEVLEARADEFEGVLERQRNPAPTHEEAAAAQAAAERRTHELVMAVLIYHHGDAPEASARRAELLEPYAIQQATLRLRFQRRLPVVDVDPDTGEEQADAAALDPSPAAGPETVPAGAPETVSAAGPETVPAGTPEPA